MTDVNWFSKAQVEVAVEGIRAEGKKWFDLSDQMAGVATLAEAQRLEVTAFAVTDLSGAVTALDLKNGYDRMHQLLNDLFRQAVKEFDSFGQALYKVADWYQTADANSAKSFDEIATS
ncbi:hypothetical protein V1634_25830 [Plantactinospora veratri]|uniref:Excreted virulence factor EspC, type VII ESX diderm n=1 Tax=Plantactinospora veratri TaxID=1436122 RepID=A0ABU7SJV8_9ACTN